MDHFIDRFKSCSSEKHPTLIRFDIIQAIKNLYDQTEDEALKQIAMELIEIEEDEKYQKKYRTVWE